MSKPIIIIGRSCSGKDTIVKQMVEEYGFEKITTYTTRPMRPGEIQDKNYHFRTEQDFLDKVNQGFFAEWKRYDTEFGPWYYGVAMEDIMNATDKSVVILTPTGFRDVSAQMDEAPDDVLLERQMLRGDDINEAKRRFEADKKDFAGITYGMVTEVIKNDGSVPVKEIAKQICDLVQMNREETVHDKEREDCEK